MNVLFILCDTLRRDHCGPYNGGRPLNQAGSAQQPNWKVPTPNMNRLAEKGTVFTQAYCGSTPCMPARRDIYTGRYEFLSRGWGPLEDDDRDLPREISGPRACWSLSDNLSKGHNVSQLFSDHFHLWEQGAGNYHMGYSGFEFIRGLEADNWRTEPCDLSTIPPSARDKLDERYFRQRDFTPGRFPYELFQKAADWLEHNHSYEDWYLHLDCFPPHEPWDPPDEYLERYGAKEALDPAYARAPYDEWSRHMSGDELRNFQARYAAAVEWTDHCLGMVLDKLDEMDLWKDTLVIFTSDHGTFNGDHGRTGKLQTHQFAAIGHVPFIVCHPTLAHGETRDQIVQHVDVYPTTLAALGKPMPDLPTDKPLHGVNLLPVLEDATAPTREYALMGMFGRSMSITDGRWTLHQSPHEENQPLYWESPLLSRYMPIELGPIEDNCRRRVQGYPSWDVPTWLSDRESDPNELENLADRQPEKVRELRGVMKAELQRLHAPSWQPERLGL